MADIYDIDTNLQVGDLIPPDKRVEPTKSIVKALLYPIQWMVNSLFGGFKKGIVPSAWAAGSYVKYDQVLYNKKVYMALTTTANIPTNTNDWLLIQDNFIGIDDRIKYNGQKLVIEWALNKNFGGAFRQPATGLNSDIYISTLAAVVVGFVVGQTEPFCSTLWQMNSSETIGYTYPFLQVNNFQINIPAALFAATNESAIRNFVDKYIPVSLNYIIVTY